VEFMPFWYSWKFAVAKYAIAAQARRLHHAPECFTQIRRNAVTVVKMVLCRNEFSFRLEHHEVGIETFGDAALTQITSGKARWTLGHPSRDICERESSGSGLRPHHRQRQREASDSTPRRLEVSFVEPLH